MSTKVSDKNVCLAIIVSGIMQSCTFNLYPVLHNWHESVACSYVYPSVQQLSINTSADAPELLGNGYTTLQQKDDNSSKHCAVFYNNEYHRDFLTIIIYWGWVGTPGDPTTVSAVFKEV